MATHYDDEAQFDALRKWWQDNWKALAAGLGIGLAAIFGWEGYQGSRESRALQASQIYDDLQRAREDGQAKEVNRMADTLAREFAASPYAALARLQQADLALTEGQLDAARAALLWAADNSDDAALTALANLRLARVDFERGQLDAALTRLNSTPPGFESLYLELRGDVLLAQGDRGGAQGAYREALAALDAAAPNRQLLQYKIDDLADVEQS